jgi:hypothetical protein
VSVPDPEPPRLWRRALQLSLSIGALGAAACSTTTVAQRTQPPGVAEMQGRAEPASFRFWAPSGTSFAWTERRQFDAALIGTDVIHHDESELRWAVSMHPSSGDMTVIDQRLVHASYEHDGRVVVSGAPDALIQLVVDSEGTLESVSGLEDASRAVRALASPDAEPVVARMFSREALGSLVRVRAQVMLGDVVGRPTGEGKTWIVPQRAGGNARFTRYTVEGNQPCNAGPGAESTTCTQLRVWVDVEPRAAQALARSLIDQYGKEQGHEIAPIAEWSGGYTMWGTVLVQPATLMPAGATLREAGHLSMESRGRRYEVQMRAITDDTFDYGPGSVASAPAAGVPR